MGKWRAAMWIPTLLFFFRRRRRRFLPIFFFFFYFYYYKIMIMTQYDNENDYDCF